MRNCIVKMCLCIFKWAESVSNIDTTRSNWLGVVRKNLNYNYLWTDSQYFGISVSVFQLLQYWHDFVVHKLLTPFGMTEETKKVEAGRRRHQMRETSHVRIEKWDKNCMLALTPSSSFSFSPANVLIQISSLLMSPFALFTSLLLWYLHRLLLL